MEVLHVIPSMSQSSGGPSAAMSLMGSTLVAMGMEITVATTDDNGHNQHMAVSLGQAIKTNGVPHYYFRKQTELYKVSLPLFRWLRRHVRDYDVVHIHALFSFASVAAARCACRSGVPYVVLPHGVLNRYGMTQRRRSLKRLSFQLVERPVLNHAAAMHYTSELERIEAEAAGATARPFVIPIGIDVALFQNLPDPRVFERRWPKANDREVVLFLSRIHPKKRLELLLDAFVELKQRRPAALLVVAGDGDANYVNGLMNQAERLGIADDIVWTGFLDGTEKLAAFSIARMFVLPSHSENFGIAVVEALAAGVPTIISREVGIAKDIEAALAGIVVEREPTRLAQAMERLLVDAGLSGQLSANARKLAVERYSLEAMGASLCRLYQEILQETKSK